MRINHFGISLIKHVTSRSKRLATSLCFPTSDILTLPKFLMGSSSSLPVYSLLWITSQPKTNNQKCNKQYGDRKIQADAHLPCGDAKSSCSQLLSNSLNPSSKVHVWHKPVLKETWLPIALGFMFLHLQTYIKLRDLFYV